MKKYVVSIVLLVSTLFLYAQGYECNWVTGAGGTGADVGSCLVWSGNDNSGRSVSSGIYIVKLQTGGSVSTMKMVLVK
ncbi:MAG: hypothetical protein R6V77_04415 [Candidatus Cloacimonadaceae bacterium]